MSSGHCAGTSTSHASGDHENDGRDECIRTPGFDNVLERDAEPGANHNAPEYIVVVDDDDDDDVLADIDNEIRKITSHCQGWEHYKLSLPPQFDDDVYPSDVDSVLKFIRVLPCGMNTKGIQPPSSTDVPRHTHAPHSTSTPVLGMEHNAAVCIPWTGARTPFDHLGPRPPPSADVPRYTHTPYSTSTPAFGMEHDPAVTEQDTNVDMAEEVPLLISMLTSNFGNGLKPIGPRNLQGTISADVYYQVQTHFDNQWSKMMGCCAAAFTARNTVRTFELSSSLCVSARAHTGGDLVLGEQVDRRFCLLKSKPVIEREGLTVRGFNFCASFVGAPLQHHTFRTTSQSLRMIEESSRSATPGHIRCEAAVRGFFSPPTMSTSADASFTALMARVEGLSFVVTVRALKDHFMQLLRGLADYHKLPDIYFEQFYAVLIKNVDGKFITHKSIQEFVNEYSTQSHSLHVNYFVTKWTRLENTLNTTIQNVEELQKTLGRNDSRDMDCGSALEEAEFAKTQAEHALRMVEAECERAEHQCDYVSKHHTFDHKFHVEDTEEVGLFGGTTALTPELIPSSSKPTACAAGTSTLMPQIAMKPASLAKESTILKPSSSLKLPMFARGNTRSIQASSTTTSLKPSSSVKAASTSKPSASPKPSSPMKQISDTESSMKGTPPSTTISQSKHPKAQTRELREPTQKPQPNSGDGTKRVKYEDLVETPDLVARREALVEKDLILTWKVDKCDSCIKSESECLPSVDHGEITCDRCRCKHWKCTHFGRNSRGEMKGRDKNIPWAVFNSGGHSIYKNVPNEFLPWLEACCRAVESSSEASAVRIVRPKALATLLKHGKFRPSSAGLTQYQYNPATLLKYDPRKLPKYKVIPQARPMSKAGSSSTKAAGSSKSLENHNTSSGEETEEDELAESAPEREQVDEEVKEDAEEPNSTEDTAAKVISRKRPLLHRASTASKRHRIHSSSSADEDAEMAPNDAAEDNDMEPQTTRDVYHGENVRSVEGNNLSAQAEDKAEIHDTHLVEPAEASDKPHAQNFAPGNQEPTVMDDSNPSTIEPFITSNAAAPIMLGIDLEDYQRGDRNTQAFATCLQGIQSMHQAVLS
ncbi:hypothetical protein LXA43DRAFT_1057814 [Ganoderma leucocontextum]|nr:hypothetical protein LXA43DRAFT_1057814 [Ganoderma leucocontextum]